MTNPGKKARSPFEHRSSKKLSRKVNGETEQTQSNQILEVQARKRS